VEKKKKKRLTSTPQTQIPPKIRERSFLKKKIVYLYPPLPDPNLKSLLLPLLYARQDLTKGPLFAASSSADTMTQ
jgi:hypothetical protein